MISLISLLFFVLAANADVDAELPFEGQWKVHKILNKEQPALTYTDAIATAALSLTRVEETSVITGTFSEEERALSVKITPTSPTAGIFQWSQQKDEPMAEDHVASSIEGCGQMELKFQFKFDRSSERRLLSHGPYTLGPTAGVYQFVFLNDQQFYLALHPNGKEEARVTYLATRAGQAHAVLHRYGPAILILILYIGGRVVNGALAERKRLLALRQTHLGH